MNTFQRVARNACVLACIWQIFRVASGLREDPFIGWRGATYNPQEVWKRSVGEATRPQRLPGSGERRRWIEQVSWTPRAFVFHNFLSESECDHIVKLAAPQMKRSTVVGDQGSVVHDIRTSYGTFLRRLQDDVIMEVEERLANWTHLPMINQEDMQVLRYGIDQKYGAHSDVLDEGERRMVTVLMYLTDTEEGGETAFPNDSEWINPTMQEMYGPWSECANGHVAAKSRKGDALMFFSLHLNGSEDQHAMHTGCPVVQGLKWTATKWIHVAPFRPEGFRRPDPHDLPQDAGICQDLDAECPIWAKSGECERNPQFMVGESSDQLGRCRLSCGDCSVCSPYDDSCYKQNREKRGYLDVTHDFQMLGLSVQ